MELFDEPLPLAEVVKHLLAKDLLPTSLDSAALRQVNAAIRRQSIFSAQTLLTYHLDKIKAVVASIVEPDIKQRPDRVTASNPQGKVTTGMTPATAKAALRKGLEDNGYLPKTGEKGTIKDLSSDARLNLVVKMNMLLAQGAGTFIRGNGSQDVVDLFPAWELVRFEDRRVPRGEKVKAGALVPDPENGWPERFQAAAQASGDTDAARVLSDSGRMIARKDSPLWAALGDGAGGHNDTFNNPYPPFAFNTGMNWLEVRRKDCIALGLIKASAKVSPADFDFASLFGNRPKSASQT